MVRVPQINRDAVQNPRKPGLRRRCSPSTDAWASPAGKRLAGKRFPRHHMGQYPRTLVLTVDALDREGGHAIEGENAGLGVVLVTGSLEQSKGNDDPLDVGIGEIDEHLAIVHKTLPGGDRRLAACGIRRPDIRPVRRRGVEDGENRQASDTDADRRPGAENQRSMECWRKLVAIRKMKITGTKVSAT